MALKALCVGINNYPGIDLDLEGCVNDAHDWRDLLSQRGFEVKQLLDSKATKAAMLREIRALMRNARAGDVVVITYSGHGSWIPDTPKNPEEDDGRDEALCPHDVKTKGVISDDKLAEIYDSLRTGVHSVFIADSCHSGSVTRTKAMKGKRFLPPAEFLHTEELAKARAVETKPAKGKSRRQGVMLVSAARDDESAYDAQFGGRPNGAFTHYALLTINDLQPDSAYKDWLEQISRHLPTQDWPQTPGLYGTPEQESWLVFDGETRRSNSKMTATKERLEQDSRTQDVRASVPTYRWDEMDLQRKVEDLLNRRRRVRLLVEGVTAAAVAVSIQRARDGAREPATIVALTLIIAVVTAIGLGVIAAICIVAMSLGYRAEVKHEVKGPWVFDDKLYINLIPPK